VIHSLLVLISLAVFVFLVSYWTTKLLCAPNSKLYLLDNPNERSLHASPTLRTGGLAILASLGVGLFMLLVLNEAGRPQPDTLSNSETDFGSGTIFLITGTAFVLAIVSFWDDRAGLSPSVRFCVHVLSAAGIVWWSRMTIDTVAVPLFGTFSLGWLAALFTILFIVWMTNLYNFMDGIDGLASGMTVVGFVFLSSLGWTGGHSLIAPLSLLVVGATAGFLPYNMPPARIFMGDVGSVPLGFLAGVFVVMGVHDGLFDIWVPVLIFSPFIVDATVTLARRLIRGEKIWLAHREHYYQRLVLSGWSHRKTLLIEYLLMLACAVSAVMYSELSEQWRLLLLLGWVAVYSLLAIGVHSLERYGMQCGLAP